MRHDVLAVPVWYSDLYTHKFRIESHKKIQARSKILALNSSNGPKYKLQIKTFHITGVSTSHGYLCKTTKISIATLTIHFIASHFNTAKRIIPNNEQG